MDYIKVSLGGELYREMIADAIDALQVRSFIRKPFQFRDLLKTLQDIMAKA